MSKSFIICVVLTIIYVTFMLTNIYAQEDMTMLDLGWTMVPAVVPWPFIFFGEQLKRNLPKANWLMKLKN